MITLLQYISQDSHYTVSVLCADTFPRKEFFVEETDVHSGMGALYPFGDDLEEAISFAKHAAGGIVSKPKTFVQTQTYKDGEFIHNTGWIEQDTSNEKLQDALRYLKGLRDANYVTTARQRLEIDGFLQT